MDITVDRALMALQEIGKASPEELTRWLYMAFDQIVKMDEGQAIAAWQTLDVCATRFSPESEPQKIIGKFQKAIVSRMGTIARTSPYSWASETFEDVTGRKFSR